MKLFGSIGLIFKIVFFITILLILHSLGLLEPILSEFVLPFFSDMMDKFPNEFLMLLGIIFFFIIALIFIEYSKMKN